MTEPHGSLEQVDASEPNLAPPPLVVPVAAVRTLYATERRAAEYDILVATALECLAQGGLPRAALHTAVQRVWPGAKIVTTNIDAALAAGEAANLLHQADNLFRLSELGMVEVEKSRQWAEDTYHRTAAELKESAARALREISDNEAQLWVGVLGFALLRGVAAAASTYRGEVDIRGNSLVSPRTIDIDEIRRTLDKSSFAPEVHSFLNAMVLDAIDPTVPFGNELISSITTGYLLQAFVARRDALAARHAIGSIRGQTVVLDTPVLFQLLTPPSVDSPMRRAVRAALEIGVRVVALAHSFEEMEQVFKRIERNHLLEINRATQTRRTLTLFRQLINEPLIDTYLLGYSTGEFPDWASYRHYVQDLGKRLEADGVELRDHDNGPNDNVDLLFARLSAVLADRPNGRGIEETRRDANTMAYAWRHRQERPAGDGVWPNAWVLTTDTAMAVAYRRTNKEDASTLTVTPSQWVSILSAFQSPADIEELAKSGAVMLAQETMLRVAARYPPSAVVEIVEALGGTANETDIRVAQTSLDSLLRDMPDLGTDPKALGIAAASKMLEQRSRRLEQVQATYMTRINADREALAEAQREVELGRAADAARIEALELRLAEVTRKQEGTSTLLVEAQMRGRRRSVQLAMLFGSLLLAGIAGAVWWASDVADPALGSLAATFAISAIAVVLVTEPWVDDPRVGVKRVGLAFLPHVLAIPGVLQSLGIALPWK